MPDKVDVTNHDRPMLFFLPVSGSFVCSCSFLKNQNIIVHFRRDMSTTNNEDASKSFRVSKMLYSVPSLKQKNALEFLTITDLVRRRVWMSIMVSKAEASTSPFAPCRVAETSCSTLKQTHTVQAQTPSPEVPW